MKDREFENLLVSSLSELPPEDIVHSVTPWRRSMRMVLVGFALSSITFHFFYLQYILPIIGILLTVLGFRMLRRENPWFFGCYLLSLVRLLYQYSILMFEATLYGNQLLTGNLEIILVLISVLQILALYVCFSMGLSVIQKKAGRLPTKSGVWLIVWYLAVGLLALVQYQGYLIAIAILILFVLILRGLVRVMHELDEVGYVILPTRVRVSDAVFGAIALGLLVIGMVLGILFFHSYPMQWQERASASNQKVETVREELRSLGFPQSVLDDLTDADILSCESAEQVVVDTRDWAMNDGRRVQEFRDGVIYVDTVYDTYELRITGVAVKLSETRDTWKLFHHFEWLETPRFMGTQSIKIWSQTSHAWFSKKDYSGQLLFDREGKTFTSPYYTLGDETYTEQSIFWGNRSATDVFAEFSFPQSTTAPRGYLSYTILGVKEDMSILDSWIDYTHQKSLWQFPFMTAKDARRQGIMLDSKAFKTVQDAIQFYPHAVE